MDDKPLYYDGSDLTLLEGATKNSGQQQDLQITDEMRASIGRNPYAAENEE